MRGKKLTACALAAAMAASVALTGCGSSIDQNAVGATLNGEDISLGLMNFIARYQQAVTDSTYQTYYGAGMLSTEMWSTEYDGTTMEDSTKDSVLDMIETIYLLEDHMEDYGVEIRSDEMASIQEAAQQFMSDNSSKAIRQMGATQEYVAEMLRMYTIQYKMQNAIYNASEITVTDEEAAQRTFSYFTVSATSGTDEDGNSVEYTDEEKEAFAQEMETIAAAAKEDFDGVAEEHGYTVSTYTYGADETTMNEAVIEAADALKEGEVSDLITTDTSYYVIRLDDEFDEEATEQEKETLLNQRKSEEYTEICDGYKEEATFEVNEDEWAKVKFDRLFGAATSVDDTTEE